MGVGATLRAAPAVLTAADACVCGRVGGARMRVCARACVCVAGARRRRRRRSCTASAPPPESSSAAPERGAAPTSPPVGDYVCITIVNCLTIVSPL
jgi:hypothetical protein